MYLPNILCNTDDLTFFNQLNEELCINSDKMIDWSKHHK
jgi:hypothetical protein